MTKELSEILTRKDFKTFWHCLDFLVIAGYPLMEAFNHSIKQFSANNIFKNVAFIRIEEPKYHLLSLENLPRKMELKIGIISDDNIHLDGMYATYRKLLINKPYLGCEVNLEATCEVITIECSSLIILEYLSDVSLAHFGYDALKTVEDIIKSNERYQEQQPPVVGNYFTNMNATESLDEIILKLNKR